MSGWRRELGLGTRLALAGGRASWTRTLMTAMGVGLGVTLLLLAASAPHALDGRDARNAARDDYPVGRTEPPRSDRTALITMSDTTFRDENVRGRLVRTEGPQAPAPPGMSRLPGPGEVVVSPRLRDLLASNRGALLRPRIPGRIVGTIGDAGLQGPRELAYYAGDRSLRHGGEVRRIARFGTTDEREGLPPVLALLVVIAVVVLLLPVAVFVAAAVRFGGEERDRRLAALSLVGADRRMVRRIAAGEALLGALLGLVTGGVLFLLSRQLARAIGIDGLSVFPSDLRPSAWLVALIVVAVPVVAVVVTQFALGRVAIDPLGVVRHGFTRRRRIWWRLLLPIAGLALLVPLVRVDVHAGQEVDPVRVSAGVTLLLLGVTAILPWLVEATVHRLRGGAVPWQLAVRRLQADSGTSARVVSGIAVAVAGAIALQMLFATVEDRSTVATGRDVSAVQARVAMSPGAGPRDRRTVASALRATDGVRPVFVVSTVLVATSRDDVTTVTVAPCATLRRIARVGSCANGSSYLVRGDDSVPRAGSVVRDTAAPGAGTLGHAGSDAPRWRVPADARSVRPRNVPNGGPGGGILATPAAVPAGALPGLAVQADVRVAPGRVAPERLRNAAAALSPQTHVYEFDLTRQDTKFVAIRRGILVAAIAVLLLIGASMLVSALEQLHERRRLLSSLVAFGTPPRTIRRSILLQTAVPVGLGLGLAVVAGVGLGAVLLRLVDAPFRVDAAPVLLIVGIGAALVPLVTALSAPALRRALRPGGLRTE